MVLALDPLQVEFFFVHRTIECGTGNDLAIVLVFGGFVSFEDNDSRISVTDL